MLFRSRWLKSGHHEPGEGRGPLAAFTRGFERLFDAISNGYASVQVKVLRVRWLMLAMSVLLLCAAMSVIPLHLVSTEYAPQEDDGQFQLSLTLPVGTSLAVTNEVTLQMESLLASVKDIVSVYSSVGSGGGPNASTNTSNLTIEATEKNKRDRSLDDIMAEVRTKAKLLPDTNARTTVSNPLSGGSNSIGIDILGDDLPTLSELGNRIVDVAKEVNGITNAQNSFQQQQTELRFSVDRDRASAVGVTTTQVSNTLLSCRDSGDWATLVSCFHPDARVTTSWFDGTAEEFAKASKNMMDGHHKKDTQRQIGRAHV